MVAGNSCRDWCDVDREVWRQILVAASIFREEVTPEYQFTGVSDANVSTIKEESNEREAANERFTKPEPARRFLAHG
jgi:hypothetical protein